MRSAPTFAAGRAPSLGRAAFAPRARSVSSLPIMLRPRATSAGSAAGAPSRSKLTRRCSRPAAGDALQRATHLARPDLLNGSLVSLAKPAENGAASSRLAEERARQSLAVCQGGRFSVRSVQRLRNTLEQRGQEAGAQHSPKSAAGRAPSLGRAALASRVQSVASLPITERPRSAVLAALPA